MLSNSSIEEIQSLKGTNIYITSVPEILDFTTNSTKERLLICGKEKGRFEIPLVSSGHDLIALASALCMTHPQQNEKLVIGWNIKSLYSFILGKLRKPLKLNGKIIDLQLMERFFGINNPAPKTYHEAEKRLANVMLMPTFAKYKQIYTDVHKPLFQHVLPDIETTGMADNTNVLYSCYDIEGQVNGRLRCSNAYKYSFNPHNLSDELKANLKSTDPNDDYWMYFDFKSMEVYVLQWLSGDLRLKAIFENSEDVYCGIWKDLTGIDCNEHHRDVCKKIFLPVMFGATYKTLMNNIPNMDEDTARSFIKKINSKFHMAMNWILQQQDNIDNYSFVTDYFGRRRDFSDNASRYKIRNFVVQSPAALICLHKLVKLHEAMIDFEFGKLVLHVHDGYMIRSKESYKNELHNVIKEILENEDILYSGLKLQVGCESGSSLKSLNTIT